MTSTGFTVYVVWTGEAAPLGPPAKYLLLTPHYLDGGLVPAGATVTEGLEIPFGWIPTVACDPLNTQAIQAFWNVGPRPVSGAEYSQDYYWSAPLFQQPVVYWQPAAGKPEFFQLTGAGASLGARPSG